MVPKVLKSIQIARIERNQTQESIASKLNLTQSYYAKIEAGKAKLTIELFFKLLNILELDYVDFFKEIKKRDIKCCHQ